MNKLFHKTCLVCGRAFGSINESDTECQVCQKREYEFGNDLDITEENPDYVLGRDGSCFKVKDNDITSISPFDIPKGSVMKPISFLNTKSDNKPAVSEFTKKDNGKLEWDLMPFEELEDVVKILMFGAEKYSKDNWKKCDDVSRYKNALMRHVIAYIKGDKIDDESNLSHLAHAICNCLFLMYFDNHSNSET